MACLNKINEGSCPDLQARFCCPNEQRDYILLAMPGLKSMRVELHAIEQMVKQRYQIIGVLSIDLLVQESDSVKLFSFYSADDLLVGLDVMSKLFNHMPEYFDQTCHLPLISTVLSSNTKKYDRMIIISGIYR